jgi:hypothetical protein
MTEKEPQPVHIAECTPDSVVVDTQQYMLFLLLVSARHQSTPTILLISNTSNKEIRWF